MNTRLQRSPVYQQLNDRLRSALAEEYRRGDRFLTERQIAERFDVSRVTANKALASLVSEGVLEFRHGIGTFVRRDASVYDIRSLVSFTEKARAAGKKPTTELITFGEITAGDAGDEIRRALAAADDEPLWEMERLRLADGTPVILEHRFVLRRHCQRLTKQHAEGSLYSAWTKVHRLEISGADVVTRAVTLTKAEAEHLRTAARSAALEVVAVGFLADESPLWWERTLYRGDKYELHSHLGPIQSATPSRGRFRDF